MVIVFRGILMFDKRSFLVLIFIFALVGFVFSAGVDLAIVHTSVDGNLYGADINFSIDYNNVGDTNATANYNIYYKIDGNDVNIATIDSNLDVNAQASNSYVWDANLYGYLDVNICVKYTGDSNPANDCNTFTLHVYSVDLNAIDLNSSETAVYGMDYNLDFNYSNMGDYNKYDYNILFYIDTNLADTISLSDLNSGDSNVYTYTFNDWSLISDLNDINAYACLNYVNDTNASNNCKEFDFNAKYSDFNADDLNFSDVDANTDYGEDVNINFYYSNIGDHNLLSDYNIKYYANDTLIHTQTIHSDLNYGDSNSDYYTWTANVGGNVTIRACASYPYDYSSNNNCLSKMLHVRAVDLNAISLSLDDSSVSAGASVTATLSYKNSGDLIATKDYNIIFYEGSSAISNCNFNIDSGLIANSATQTKACTFTAPSTTTNYTIKAVLDYNGYDIDLDNNSKSTTLTVTVASTNNTSNTSTDTTSGVDLEAVSLDYPATSLVDKPVTFKLNFKNVGDDTATSSYTAKVLITHSGKTVKNCVKTISDDLASGKTSTYSCVWTPDATGYYSLTASITYVGTDDDSSNDSIVNKMVHVIPSYPSPKPKPTETAPNTKLQNGVTLLSTNKTLEVYSDVNTLISDINKSFSDMNLPLPKNVDANHLGLNVKITRDFNCGVSKDTNKPYCNVTITLKNAGDLNLIGYKFYELLPDLNIDKNARVLTFDVNKLDMNKDFNISYTVSASVDKTKQTKFLGFAVKKEPKQEHIDTVVKKSTSVFRIITLVLVGILIAILIAFIIVYIMARREDMRYKTYTKKAPAEKVLQRKKTVKKANWKGYNKSPKSKPIIIKKANTKDKDANKPKWKGKK